MATKPEFAAFMFRLKQAIPKFSPDLKDEEYMEVWYAELGALTTMELTEIYKTAVKSFDAFPSMREMLGVIGKAEQSDADKAREVAERILSAISKHGQLNGNGESAARKWAAIGEMIGPIGLAVVKMQGGWNQICELTDNDNLATMKAQWRGAAESIARRGADALDTPPDFTRLPDNIARTLASAAAKLTP